MMRSANILLLLALLSPIGLAAETPDIRIHLKTPDCVYGQLRKDGTIHVEVVGSLMIMRTSALAGLRLPVNLGGNSFSPHATLSLSNETHSEILHYRANEEPYETGFLILEMDQRFSFPVFEDFDVPAPGRYKLDAQLEAVDGQGKRVLLNAAPLQIRVSLKANQSSEPTPASGTSPAGQEPRLP